MPSPKLPHSKLPAGLSRSGPVGPRGKHGFAALALIVCAIAAFATACGVPPELQPQKSYSYSNTSPSPSPSLPPGYSPRASVSASPSAFPESSAAPCAGRVTADQIAALVKLKASVTPGKAIIGPLCAGSWHYTVFEVPGKENIRVVTIGTVSGLTLFAAGTDVCTPDVIQQAPIWIRAAASC